jgi:hypothetical protein
MSLRREGTIVTFRMTRWERVQLEQRAAAAETTLSEFIRDTLHDVHGIGEFPPSPSLPKSGDEQRKG